MKTHQTYPFTGSRHVLLTLCLILAVSMLISLTACQTASPETTSPPVETGTAAPASIICDGVDVPDAVLAAAKAYVQEQYDYWTADPYETGAVYDCWRVKALERVWQYEALEGCDVDVYRLDYHLHTTTPDKVLLAGGMELDEEGWHLPTYPGSTYLHFDVTDGGPVYLFQTMENDCQPGDEMFTSDLTAALLHHILRPQAEEQARALLVRETGADDVRITLLRPYQTFRTLAEDPVLAYQTEWEVLRDGTWAPGEAAPDGEEHYLFYRQEGHSCTLLDLKDVGRDLERAATEALWGLSDLEFALTPIDPPAWYGLGGPADLDGLAGTRLSAETLDGAVSYAPGDAWERGVWDGLTAEYYVSPEGETSIWKLETTRAGLFTCRGVSVGDSREAVLTSYPDASAEPAWGFEGDYLWYGPGGGYGFYFVFYFDGDTISRLELINMFN